MTYMAIDGSFTSGEGLNLPESNIRFDCPQLSSGPKRACEAPEVVDLHEKLPLAALCA